MAVTLHCTKKLLDRIQPQSLSTSGVTESVLGNWYATVLFWKPQVALLVNENTLLPVLMPFAPATNLVSRFPESLARVLAGHGMPASFIDNVLVQMAQVHFAKTSNRSVVGIMNEFSYLAEHYRAHFEEHDLLSLSLRLSETPCSPLYKSAISPDRALKQLLNRS